MPRPFRGFYLPLCMLLAGSAGLVACGPDGVQKVASASTGAGGADPGPAGPGGGSSTGNGSSTGSGFVLFPDPMCPPDAPEPYTLCNSPSSASCSYPSACDPVGCTDRCIGGNWLVDCARCAGPAPECPAAPPIHGAPCATQTGTAKCTWDKCDEQSFVWATCNGEKWDVHYSLCDPPGCYANSGAGGDDPPLCSASTVCVDATACSTGAAFNCAANPCKNQPFSCACAGVLCGPYLTCTGVKAGVVTCAAKPASDGRVDLVGGQDRPGGLVLGDQEAYFNAITQSSPTNALRSVPKVGGAATVIAASDGGTFQAADALTLYYADYDTDNVFARPFGGGPPVLLAQGQSKLRSLFLDAQSVYWARDDGGTIAGMPKGGGVPVTLASGIPSLAGPAASDGVTLYFGELGAPAILQVPAVGGPVTMFASINGYANGLAVDDTYVYWSDRGCNIGGPDNGEVLRAPKSGGPPQLLASGETCPAQIVLRDGIVYWASWDTAAAGGVIRAVPVAGGAVTTIVKNTAWVSSLAVDETRVFWTTSAGPLCGGVWSIPR